MQKSESEWKCSLTAAKLPSKLASKSLTGMDGSHVVIPEEEQTIMLRHE